MRVALIWDSTAMRSQQVLSGLCRLADAEARLNLRRFDAQAADFREAVTKPLLAWKPHGVILRMDDAQDLVTLRKKLSGIPFVAACRMPAGIADTMVVGNAQEVARVSRDHLLSRGARTIALLVAGRSSSAEVLTGLFHQTVPGGPVLALPISTAQLRSEPKGAVLRAAGDWLRSLRKPAGVLTFTGEVAPFLSRVCQKIGLRVPKDIQLIGCDDPDVCMACTPHITTVIPTGEQIGEAAMEAMLRHLTPGATPPPLEIRIQGCTLTARGSTGQAAVVSRSTARTVDLIRAQATKGLTTSKLVRASRQGRSTFYKQFRETTGTTPGKELRESRIAAACRMLESSSATISRISEQCGFSSANYFAQVFRRHIGQSPGEYRSARRG
ncbi:substrate-binding domain-containing protein [Haloferula sp. BvORR071]|uniref:substrate-binding domain-containing protein n=1 Tax=Haloferula sp. BvORR071 TaxID=1396141 RepID=UPI00055813EB|nr:substrate-binding domain-containing protein [Haloferula sp. BvORR071]